MGRLRVVIRLHVAVAAICLIAAGSSRAQCPPPELLETRLEELDLAAAWRSIELKLEPPVSLYKRASAEPGRVVIQRDRKLGQAVVVAAQPIGSLWMAINDDDHHADGDFLPIRHSQVIGGTSRGKTRVLFQYFKRYGVGRWWIEEVKMNRDLYLSSDGQLWELRWRDLMATHGEESLPEEFSELGLSPIRESRGAWLMMALNESCTLIEYVTVTKPGGFLNLAQWFAARHVIRETLEGIQRLAREHIPQPHPEARFVRPDGSVIEVPPGPH